MASVNLNPSIKPTMLPKIFADVDLYYFSSNSSQGFKLFGDASDHYNAYSVASATDINRDSYSDAIIGATYAQSCSRSDAVISYVVFGKTNSSSDLDLAKLTFSQGFKILGDTIAAYSLPSILNYALTKAFLPNSEISISTLDMLGSSSFGVVRCYDKYKTAYEDEAQATTTDLVVSYIVDAITLWSLSGYMRFDTSNIGNLMSSLKNAINVAATTHAVHCMSDMVIGEVPKDMKEEYVYPVLICAGDMYSCFIQND